MRIVLTFLLNAGMNFAVGLAIAAVLGPGDYGQFAVGATASVVLATGLFDWLRLSTTRFYGDKPRESDPGLRATLNAAYLGLVGLLILCAAAVLGFGIEVGVSTGLAAAIVLGAIANGAFDFHAALARARFRDRAYAVLVIGKSGLGLLLAVGVAFISKKPGVVLAAQAVGTLIAIVPVRRDLCDGTLPRRKFQPGRLRKFAAYGMPVVAANVVFQLVLLMNRSVAAAGIGYAAAGQLSLATDVSLRLLLAAGAAIDVFVFQTAVRREAEEGRQAADAQLRSNMVVVTAILLFLGTGFAIVLPAFSALLVPGRFRADFVPLSMTILPGIVLFCLGQFAINPVFQMAGRTAPITAGAVVSVAVDGLGLLCLSANLGVGGIALLHSISLGLGFVAVAVVALQNRAVRPPVRDVICIIVAAAAMALALWPIRGIASPTVALLVAAVIGPCIYGGVILILDVAGFRSQIRTCAVRFGYGPIVGEVT